jgi:hypothetical protein
MKSILDYIKNNSTLLFKHLSKNSLKAIFDSKGFWLSEEAQIVYNKIKNQPHIYVAWTLQDKGYYYVGKSFQNGGRWKREHAYHLGTLAYHLLDNIRSDDQNHSHWIDAWMDRNTIKIIDNHNYSINLKERVYICFIPFEKYSELKYKILSPKLIKAINHDNENKLIKYYQNKGITLLNVQNNDNRKKQKTSSSLKRLPPQKNSTTNDLLVNKNCYSFKVDQNELIHSVAQTKHQLPVGPCYIIIKDEVNQNNYVYVKANGDPVRKITTKGKTVSDYFKAPDTNYSNKKNSKSRVVQIEMEKRKIQSVIVTVCVDTPSISHIDSLPKSGDNVKPSNVSKSGKYNKAALSGDSESCKIVFICAKQKKPNSDLKIRNNIIRFRAISKPAANEFNPDDIISKTYLNELNNLTGFKLVNGSTWRDLINKNSKKGNPLKLRKAYELYKEEIYRDLYTRFGDRFYILSAGWGLVRSDMPLPKYDITFNNESPINTIRKSQLRYKDFNHLSQNIEDIIFIGIPSYLKLFYELTGPLICRKIVFWKGQNAQKILLPNNSFELRYFKSNNNRNWYKILAKYVIEVGCEI